jgi:hypothetical protein
VRAGRLKAGCRQDCLPHGSGGQGQLAGQGRNPDFTLHFQDYKCRQVSDCRTPKKYSPNTTTGNPNVFPMQRFHAPAFFRGRGFQSSIKRIGQLDRGFHAPIFP